MKISENLLDQLKKLFNREIIWRKAQPSGKGFIAEVDGEKCKLRINDFPDEPLYTLIYKGIEYDFDDAPEIWKIPW